MRRREPPRVVGPYCERKRWRIVVIEHGTRRSVFAPTEAEALKLKKRFEKEIAGPPMRTLGDVIDAFLTDRMRAGDWRPVSEQSTRSKLNAFFGSVLDADIGQLTVRRAASLYQAATEKPTRYGRPASVATHRLQLRIAKRLFGWAVKRGLVASNPFVGVEPVGRVNVGKRQLRLDEARSFAETALRMWAEQRDTLALSAACALFMGLRASEILERRARDLDAGGTLLVIENGKTKNAVRSPKIPAVLRPHLLELMRGLGPEDLLIPGTNGQRRRNSVLLKKVKQICRAAGVPVVCTHALRGCNATFALEAGATSEVVARSLGHGSFEVTKRHYARADAVGNAQSAALVSVLTRPALAATLVGLPASELLELLPSDVLAELVSIYLSSQRNTA